MKTNASCMRAPVGCTLLLACAAAAAQDPAAVGTGIYKCTMENEHARVCEVTFAPGAKMPSHSHPAHIVYVVEPGKLRITDDATGKSEDHDFKAGQTVWMDSVTHHAVNVGNKTLRGIVVEFRDLKDQARTMNEAPRTMNEAPPTDMPISSRPPGAQPPMEKPQLGQPPVDQAPPMDDPMDDGSDDPSDP